MSIDLAAIETSGETLRCPACRRYVPVLLVRAGWPRCRRCLRAERREGDEP